VNRYLETFRRHRVALVLPVLIALVLSSYVAMSKPHKYQSAMSVWFDTATPNTSSLVSLQGSVTPAQQGQQTLQEFLGTRQFLVAVGRNGPVGAALGKVYRGTALDDQIVAVLNKAITVAVAGPQVVTISMTSTNPGYIPGTLSAVATEYVAEITSTIQSRDQATQGYYQTELAAAQSSLTAADQRVAGYLMAHPNASIASDVTYNQLSQAAIQAQENLTTVQSNLGQANLSVQNVSGPASFHVVDAAPAAVEVSSKKHMVFTVVAGLAAGVVISLLALSALTGFDKTARRTEDIETVLGLQVVGTIDELPRRVRALGAPGDRR
jgi:uncharacterized protein involved in exopolysaccharide biosynthesis